MLFVTCRFAKSAAKETKLSVTSREPGECVSWCRHVAEKADLPRDSLESQARQDLLSFAATQRATSVFGKCMNASAGPTGSLAEPSTDQWRRSAHPLHTCARERKRQHHACDRQKSEMPQQAEHAHGSIAGTSQHARPALSGVAVSVRIQHACL